MSLGWSSAESRLRHIGKMAEMVHRSKQASVVFYDPESGVVDWPEVINQRGGCLLVARPFEQSEKGESEWLEWVGKYGQQGG